MNIDKVIDAILFEPEGIANKILEGTEYTVKVTDSYFVTIYKNGEPYITIKSWEGGPLNKPKHEVYDNAMKGLNRG